jgi:trimeric autotransporter adhesin
MAPDAFGGFSAEDISHISDWSHVNASRVAHLQPTSCCGFSPINFMSLSIEGISGFSAQHTANLTAATCAVFSAAAFGAFTSDAYRGFSQACFENVPPIAFTGASRAGISALPASSCQALHQLQLSNLNADAVTGISKDCVTAISSAVSSVCEGFTFNVFSNLNASSFGGFGTSCISKIPSVSWIGVHAEQIENLPGDACAGLLPSQMLLISTSAYAGLSSSCISSFSFRGKESVCGVLSAEGMSKISAAAFSAFSGACVRVMPESALSMISSAQVSHIQPSACYDLQPDQLSQLPSESYTGFTSDCIAFWRCEDLNHCVCEGLNPMGISNISAANFGAFSSSCIRMMPSSAWKLVTAEQIAHLNPDSCSGLDQAQLNNLNGSTYSGLSLSCLSNLTSSSCGGITPDGLESISPTSFRALSAGCLTNLVPLTVASIGPLQMQAVTPSATRGLRHLNFLKTETFESMQLQQIASLHFEAIRSLSGNQIAFLLSRWGGTLLESSTGWTQLQLSRPGYAQVAQIKELVDQKKLNPFIPVPTDWQAFASKITWLHFALFEQNFAEGLDAKIISAIGAYSLSDDGIHAAAAVAGMRSDQAAALTPSGIDAINAWQAQFLQNDTVSLLTVNQWKYLSPEAISSLTDYGWSAVQCETCIKMLSPDQLSEMVAWDQVPCLVMAWLSSEQVVDISALSWILARQRRYACNLPPFYRIELPSPVESAPTLSPQEPAAGGVSKTTIIVLSVIGGLLVAISLKVLVYMKLRRRGYSTIQ